MNMIYSGGINQWINNPRPPVSETREEYPSFQGLNRKDTGLGKSRECAQSSKESDAPQKVCEQMLVLFVPMTRARSDVVIDASFQIQ